jgi:hypothetical protein
LRSKSSDEKTAELLVQSRGQNAVQMATGHAKQGHLAARLVTRIERIKVYF